MYMEIKDYIIYHSAGNLYWKDLNGCYLGCNKNYADVLSLSSPQAIVGLTDRNIPKHRDLLTDHEIQALIDIDTIVVQETSVQIIEEQGLNKQGEKATYLTIKQPLRNEKGDVIGIMGTSIDISATKEVAKLKKHQEITAKVIQRLKVIAGSLSHEIKTPMAGVRMGLSLIKNFFKKARSDISQVTIESLVDQEKQVDRMIQRIDTGTALINMQLKNMTVENISVNQFRVNSIRQCIQEAVDSFPFDNPVMTEKVHISIQQNFEFWGDSLLTKHVLWNLLNNALHFIREVDRGEIFITAGKKDNQHYIRFRDTAKGMPPEQAARVFEQFYTNRSGGSGLGLNFCLMVMQAYGGSIACESIEDEYAEFILFFPTLCVQERDGSEEYLPGSLPG